MTTAVGENKRTSPRTCTPHDVFYRSLGVRLRTLILMHLLKST
jgi:hypothetical protein